MHTHWLHVQGRPTPSGIAPSAAGQCSSRRLVIVASERPNPSLLDKPSAAAKPSPLKPLARPAAPAPVQPLKPPQAPAPTNAAETAGSAAPLKPPSSGPAAPAMAPSPSASPSSSSPAAPARPPAPSGPSGTQGGYINRPNQGAPAGGNFASRPMSNPGARPPTNFPPATPGTQRVEPKPLSVSPAFQQRSPAAAAPAEASAAAAPPRPASLAPPAPPPLARPGAPAPPSLARPAAPAAPPRPAAPAAPSFGAPSSSGPGLARPPPMARPPPPAAPRPTAPSMPAMSRPGGPPALARPGQSSISGTGTNTVSITRPAARPGAPDGQRQMVDLRRPAPAAPPSRDGRQQPRRPEPPSLRVLDPIISDESLEKRIGETISRGKLVLTEVVEDDGAPAGDEEGKGKAKTKGGGKKGGKKEKVTAEMKRRARESRMQERMERQRATLVDREEIFEVGEAGMSLEELAEAIQVDASDIVRTLFMKGVMLSMNQQLDKNTVKLVAQEYELLVVDKDEDTGASAKKTDFNDESDIDSLAPRPPVVTVMGHVDHGKTSLLDYIRKARVAAGEAGGITQAIGAYNVDVEVEGESKSICFLDTPGHEAFSAMRARGARVTDIAIIIVAADDGVRPQTREAIAHAQAAEVPIIVAINKVDKPEADVERTKQGLLELNLVPEEWGGTTPMCPVSAKKGTGMEDLLQMVLWVAEEQQLMANPDKFAAGTVIEAHLDKKVGAVSTLLVQAGTLRVGDVVAAGQAFGKVRTLVNDLGQNITSAGPSIAVQLFGLNQVPQAGDEFQVYRTEADAKAAAKESAAGARLQRMAEMTGGGSMVTLSSLATMDEDMETIQRLNLIVKGDTSGMVEAIKSALSALPQDSIVLRYLLSGTGDISSSDVDLAAASGGMILGFNLNPDESMLTYAKKQGVTVSTYNVIYNLIDDVKAAMEGKLRTVEEKIEVGRAEVKAVFGTGKKKVAGCLVVDGKLMKKGVVTVTRGKAEVHEGELTSLRRVKDDVETVEAGVECGLGTAGFSDWQAGDVLTCYQVVTKARRLEEAKATTVVDISTL